MKHLSGQNTLLALSVIAVFAISGCFLTKANDSETAYRGNPPQPAAQHTTLATVK